MSNMKRLKGEEARSSSVLLGHTGVVLRCLALVLVNAGQPLLVDFLRYHGAAEPSTLLYILPTYYGMVVVGLASKTRKSMWRENWSRAFSVCLCDLLHQIAEKAGLVFAGSAAYTITASWSTVWTALLSLLILHKRLAGYQWLGILLICIGFSLKAMQVNFSETNHEAIGVLLTLIASVLHGLSFVLNEMFLTGDARMEGPNLVGMCGLISSSFLTVWMLIWTIPQWETRVLQPVEATNGSIPAIIFGYVALLLLAILRSATLWYLLQHVGAVSAGVLKVPLMGVCCGLYSVCALGKEEKNEEYMKSYLCMLVRRSQPVLKASSSQWPPDRINDREASRFLPVISIAHLSLFFQGARTAVVFVLSHYFYCHLQESQCLTSVKALSAMTCVTGVMIYSGFGYSFVAKSVEALSSASLSSYSPGETDGQGDGQGGRWRLWRKRDVSSSFSSGHTAGCSPPNMEVSSCSIASSQPLLKSVRNPTNELPQNTSRGESKDGQNDSDDDLPSFKVGSLVREEEALEIKDFMI
ncbi:transporter permease protein [Cystoisospora suis]|uniref:Transporter permease protein n=1 Tax=Cystoisospora suis TaxID=483139 RepID=A0A2C6LE27_9APIC|nr:transporter permease protein [Cystoisospora suis]